MHKLVNGQRIELTEEEEMVITQEWSIAEKEIQEKLQEENIKKQNHTITLQKICDNLDIDQKDLVELLLYSKKEEL